MPAVRGASIADPGFGASELGRYFGKASGRLRARRSAVARPARRDPVTFCTRSVNDAKALPTRTHIHVHFVFHCTAKSTGFSLLIPFVYEGGVLRHPVYGQKPGRR